MVIHIFNINDCEKTLKLKKKDNCIHDKIYFS